MALKATVCRAVVNVSDVDRHYYAEHVLTIARHPSETDERMMVRILAFALHADERLTFGAGLSDADEPDLWQRDLTGAITHWIEVGQPDEKRLLRACGRAARVTAYAYRSGAELWWTPIAHALERAEHLSVWRIPAAASQGIGKLAARTMQLQCTVQDQQVWFGDAVTTVQVEPVALKMGATGI